MPEICCNVFVYARVCVCVCVCVCVFPAIGLHQQSGGSGNGQMGFFSGQSFRYLETGHPTEDKIKLFLRYGLSLERMQSVVSHMLKEFSSIYTIQEKGQAFHTVEELLAALDEEFVNMTRVSGAEYLLSKDISARAINELVATISRVNYGQNTTMSEFATAVSMAGGQDDLWSVQGGNKQVCEGLLKLANASVVYQAVKSVERISSGDAVSYHITTTTGDTAEFDAVILAVPLQLANITFSGFPTPPQAPPGTRYQRTVATFVKGQPRGEYVGLGNLSEAAFPDLVLTLENESLAFSCIGRNDPVSGEPVRGDAVWKVFSRQPLSESDLDAMFVRRVETVVKDWLAYPHYSPPDRFVPFALDDHFFHTNTIEWAASAMEMGAIAGHNAALLLSKSLNVA